jgi:hypothetical protein
MKAKVAGFVFLEALLVLFVLTAAFGLGAAALLRSAIGPLPWRVWIGLSFLFPVVAYMMVRRDCFRASKKVRHRPFDPTVNK